MISNLRTNLLVFALVLCFCLNISAQNLTVPQIMAEPSIAGQRVEGEKLSPDGKSVIYLWNAEGKLPRDLYLSPTDHSDPKIILRISDLPKPSATPAPESKLNYGLTVRDDFVKARENALGNFEWSPDSKKLLFSQGGDLYVLTLGTGRGDQRWKLVEAALLRRADLIPNVVATIKKQGILEDQVINQVARARSNLLNLLQIPTSESSGAKSKDQQAAILSADSELSSVLVRLVSLDESYPQLRSNVTFTGLMDELNGTINRIHVALDDYEDANPKIKRFTKTQSPEVAPRFIDNDRILYQQSGNIFVLNIKDATTIQLSREANQQNFIGVGGATVSKDGKMLAYTVSDSSKQKALFVPNYLGEFVEAPTTRRGWSEQKVMIIPTDGSRDAATAVKLPKSEGVSNFRRMVWAADGRSLIVDRNDKDTKRRQLFYVHNVGSKDEQQIVISDETDDKWQAQLSVIFEPNPKDASQLFFCSEKDGYNHIYLATLESQKPAPNPTGEIRGEGEPGYSTTPTIKQLTKGNWQVEWAKWTSAGTIAYASTQTASPRSSPQESVAERQLYLYRVQTGDIIASLSPKPGMRTDFQMSESAEIPVVLFQGSTWDGPSELYVERMSETGPAGIVKLTQTTPSQFSEIRWTKPHFVDIPSRDGKKIASKYYLPTGFDNKKKYPMVIFVHGAGYLQNTINGWNNYYREFMFNELLTQKGYVVLDIDYRGSAGYGRDWRTDVYDFLGGKDMDDEVDGIDFMVKNYAVNPNKVGVYGGSYGGFMAEMLAFRVPEKIAAAAALRPVADWKNYYASSPGYTAQRLGFPDKNPDAYKRSSPISYADGLKTQLLILHGIVDDNVHVEDSMQLTEKLIRLGKTEYFTEQFYPSENHGFVRPESWTDEYSRILAFFEKNLK